MDNDEWEELPLQRDVTLLLLVLNAFVFFIEPHANQPEFRHLYEARYSLSAEGMRAGYWWQLVSYQFLHGGWIHLAANLLLLHSLGPILETTLGRRRFLILYLFSGAMGGVVHLAGAIVSPQTFGHPVVGASAGLCGLLAALGSVYSEQRVQGYLFFLFRFRVKAKYLLLLAGAISLGGALLPLGSIAHLAHLGGLVGGLLCINMMEVEPMLMISEGGDIGMPTPAQKPEDKGTDLR